MPVNRFGWLLSHLHLNDNILQPARDHPNFDKLYKVRPLLTELSKTVAENYLPTELLAIDESMIKFKGRSSLKQYMPKKPVKRGYKVWMLCASSGYNLKFDIYTVSRTLEFAATGAFWPPYPVPTICCQAMAGRDASAARGSCCKTVLVLKSTCLRSIPVCALRARQSTVSTSIVAFSQPFEHRNLPCTFYACVGFG
ncbi:hypothetical protein MRX96_059266 [Rhipicephalus microplus]